MIPGRLLHRLATALCCPGTLERIVEPAIADLQNEYARSGTSPVMQRAWILLAGYVAVLTVLVICAFDPRIAGDDRRDVRRTLNWTFICMTGVMALLALPALKSGEDGITLRQLLPQALPLAIPIGLTFGIALGLPGRAISRASARVVVVVALAASLVSFGMISWIVPATSQAARDEMAWSAGDRLVPKGPAELTLVELNREMTTAEVQRHPRIARHFAWTFHMRLALAVASVVLAVLFLVTFSAGSLVRGVFAFLVCFEYWVLLYMGEFLGVYEQAIPAFVAAWLPNIVFASAAALMTALRRSRLRSPIAALS